MILEHYSAKPLKGGPRNYRQGGLAGAYKPCGLWVSVKGEYDWPWWCEAESFRPESLKCRQIVTLKPTANILTITNGEEIERFVKRYATEEKLGTPPHVFLHRTIDWKAVATDYDGLIIAPYLWEYRMKNGYSWYYGWDCASGCIWNGKKAIASFEIVEEGNENGMAGGISNGDGCENLLAG